MGASLQLKISESESWDIEEIIEHARLPVSLHIAGRVFATMAESSSTLEDVADIIVTDVSLSAKLLKIANSPLFMGGAVGTVSEALVYIGMDDVASLIAGTEVINAFEEIPMHSNPYSFWHQNLFAATTGKVLAQHFSLPEAKLFTGALLRGIGELTLCSLAPQAVDEIADIRMNTGRALHTIEEEVIGINHAQISTAILEYWKFPESLIKPIENYLDPQQSPQYKVEAAIINMANYLKNKHFNIPQPPLANHLIYDDAEKSLELLEQLIPEIGELNQGAIKMVMND